jgi:serine phosphatase RsbU (regulator of sigma subunit)/CHASE3 domain sensor protein
MSLRARVAVMFFVGVALVAVGIVAVFATLHEESVARHAIRDRVQPASDAARSLLRALVDQESGERGYLITGRPDYLQPYSDGRRTTRAEIEKLRRLLPGDAEVQAAVARVEQQALRWQRLSAGPEIRARARGDKRLAQDLVARGTAKREFDQVRRDVGELQELLDLRLSAASNTADRDARRLRDRLIAVGILLAGLAAAAIVLARRWALDPLRALQGALRGVAAGDLGRRIEIAGPPEIRLLATDAEAMRRRIVAELHESEAAREALEQEGPVVVGLRAQLAASSVAAPPGLAIAGRLEPAEGVLAGDWYDIVALPSGMTGLILADVSGHGAEAGLVAVRMKHILTSALRVGLALPDALALVGEDLAGETDRFATCVLVEVDPRSGRLRWANAGHPAPLLVTPGGELRRLDPTGPVLSALGGAWAGRRDELEPGDVVVAYTDGLVEARDIGGQEFGEERLRATLAATDGRGPRAAVDALLEAARTFAGGRQVDDITIVALARER